MVAEDLLGAGVDFALQDDLVARLDRGVVCGCAHFLVCTCSRPRSSPPQPVNRLANFMSPVARCIVGAGEWGARACTRHMSMVISTPCTHRLPSVNAQCE